MEPISTCDDLVASLRVLRESAGQPSFGQIAASIGRMRIAGGMAAEVARPGRTTLYDVFRYGRSRIDANLVGEIVRALGVRDDEAGRWEAACREVGRVSSQFSDSHPVTPSAARRA